MENKKSIWIAIVRNSGAIVNTEPLFKLLRSKGLNLHISTYWTDFALSYKQFTPNLYGLEGIKEKVREVVPKRSQNIVIFFYKANSENHLGAWTYPNPLTDKDAFVEIPTKEEWQDGFLEEAPIHEVTHALNRCLRFQGINLLDDMDIYPGRLEGVQANMGRMEPFFGRIQPPRAVLSLLGTLLATLQTLLGLLRKKAELDLPGGTPVPSKDPVLWVEPYGLKPEVHELAQKLLRRAEEKGYTLRITEGYRSPERQDELYAQGRTKPGNIVTNAKGGESKHQDRIAFDVVDRYRGYNINWQEIGELGESLGLSWGGRWTSFPDRPHFEKV